MPFFSENHALGTNPSPWTVNGNDLYPDSTSYLVGIGTSNPEVFLHVNSSDSTANTKLQRSTSGKVIEFKHDGGTSDPYAPYIHLDTSSNYTRVRFKGTGAVPNYVFDDPVAFSSYAEFVKLISGSVELGSIANYGFSMGIYHGTPSGAMLHIKDASKPQLKLDDGTNYHALESTGGNFYLYRDATDSTTNYDYLKIGESSIDFNSLTGPVKLTLTQVFGASLNIYATGGGATGGESLLYNSAVPFGIFNGVRFEYYEASSATENLGLTTGTFIMCTLDGAQTVNLPSAGTSTKGFFYCIKDAAGTAGFRDGSGTLTKTITINPHTGGTIDGGASISIDANYGSVMLVTDGSNNWFVI